jgi:Protein of unknown function (DUF1439)
MREAKPMWRHLMRRIARFAWIGVVAGCALAPYLLGEVSMSAAELTERMGKRFPIERSMGGLIEAQLAEPYVTLDEAKNRLTCTFKLSIKLALSGKTLIGSLKISGRPEYEAAMRSLFLREAAVDHVRFDDMSDLMIATVSKAASSLAKDALEGRPLHVFKPEDFVRQGTRLEPDKLAVRGDRLVLTLKR